MIKWTILVYALNFLLDQHEIITNRSFCSSLPVRLFTLASEESVAVMGGCLQFLEGPCGPRASPL